MRQEYENEELCSDMEFLGAGAVSRMQLAGCVPITEAVFLLCEGIKLMEILAAQTARLCSASPTWGRFAVGVVINALDVLLWCSCPAVPVTCSGYQGLWQPSPGSSCGFTRASRAQTCSAGLPVCVCESGCSGLDGLSTPVSVTP